MNKPCIHRSKKKVSEWCWILYGFYLTLYYFWLFKGFEGSVNCIPLLFVVFYCGGSSRWFMPYFEDSCSTVRQFNPSQWWIMVVVCLRWSGSNLLITWRPSHRQFRNIYRWVLLGTIRNRRQLVVCFFGWPVHRHNLVKGLVMK